MVLSRSLSELGWRSVFAGGCNYICSFWTGFLTVLQLYLSKSDILTLQEESVLALQLAVWYVRGVSPSGWHGNYLWQQSRSACSSGRSQVPGSWAAHTASDLSDLSFVIWDFHTQRAQFRFSYINRLCSFRKSIQTWRAGTQLPGLFLDISVLLSWLTVVCL